MLRLVCRDVGYGSEDIRAVRSRPFDTVSMVDSSFTSFMVHIKVLEVVVEIYRSSAEISTEKGSVGREDSSDIDMSLSAAETAQKREREVVSHVPVNKDSGEGGDAQWDGKTSQPFMEMGYNSLFALVCCKLRARNAKVF